LTARFGPYRVREKLSEGAIAALYRAEHETLGRAALVKALKSTLAEGSPLGEALLREARVLGKLSHESIVRLFDMGHAGSGAWIALEEVRGPRLSELVARSAHKRLEPPAATAIALALASGLGHLHARGIVHRDLRPDVVVIGRDGRVVIVDLGAALDRAAPPSPSPFDGSETLSGPEYAAPEQIVGEAASPRSDVFSLGVMLYEMLCGVRPWEGWGRGEREGAKEVARRVRSEEPPPLAEHGVTAPRALARVVARCLAKRPEDRFEDGEALAEALAEALDEQTQKDARSLVTRALSRAGLGEEIAEGRGRRKPKAAPVPLPLWPLGGRLLVLFGLVVAGGAAVEGLLREEDVPAAAEDAEEGTGRGYLRVLARPWAEVLVDGQFVDVTPIGRPIPVMPGRHYVTFKHPNAPDEKREIRVAGGQTVVLDVTMRIDRPASDAGADAATDAAASP
jgi:serine/threonine-protein kinase